MTVWSLVIGLTPLLIAVVSVVVWRWRERRRPNDVAVLESREPRRAVRDSMRRR